MPKEKHPIPEWLLHPAVNKSLICERLKGNKDKPTVGYFTQQRQGKRPFSSEELDKLDAIKKELQDIFS